ncbi:phage tail family protein [Streptomyces ginkgonis]|uniref:phage tail family protein n=1 Tax=Streptomyces ginkgonis TaxID=1812259 RepID=UPI002176D3EF|nr:phage tail family protein [Streptomyces ginkgonis]
MSITGSNGEVISLTGFTSRSWPAIFLQPGASGLDMPPVELHSDDSPNLDGSIFRSTRTGSREIMLPVYLYGIDRRSLRDLKQRLAVALNPAHGPCRLEATEGDAQPRHLYCYYRGGMEGNEAEDSAGFRWAKYGLTFTAPDPWWYGPDLRVAEWSFGIGKPFLGRPLYPFRISLGGVDAQVPVVNPGQVEAWPHWEIKGPVRSFNLVGPSGDSFGMPSPDGADVVPDGRVLTVDTRPGHKSLIDDQGTNYWPRLAPNPRLWPIPAGRSEVALNVIAGSGTASVRLTLRPRYLTY